MSFNTSWNNVRPRSSKPLIMGVLNVTSDSFSDGGHYLDFGSAVGRGEMLFESGADIIDVGGESTRPGAKAVDIDIERSRVLPVVKQLARLGIPVSIDTQKLTLMEEAVGLGACLINDISGAQDPAVARLVERAKVGICVMHMKGLPGTMQTNPSYHNVVQEVYDFLEQRVTFLEEFGVCASQIIVDPGFGFGKTLEHNLLLLRNLAKFGDLGCSLLVGLSRKSMLGTITGKKNVADRLGSSIAASVFAVSQGADIVRVHDVNETRDALLAWQFFSEEKRVEQIQ